MTAQWAGDYPRLLVEEACKKASLIWIATPRGGESEAPTTYARPRAAWHAWHDGAAYVVTGGIEQPIPGIDSAGTVRITVRSKDTGGRLVTWLATPQVVEAGSDEWTAVVPDLHAKRLNPPDGEQQPERWGRESRIYRLEPTGEVPEVPGAMPTGSQAAAPPPSPATTRGPLPFVIGRRPGRSTPKRGRS
jgi:hypothetical protein